MILLKKLKILTYIFLFVTLSSAKLWAENASSFNQFLDKIWLERILAIQPAPKQLVLTENSEADFSDLGVLMDSIETNFVHKNPVIVIDAGHGGKDPGAIGYKKVQEKNIVLAYAKALKNKLELTKKYQVYLTRDKDVYLPLRKRIAIARKYKADMFISIHADAAHNKQASGLSVYTLSEKASTKEAALLAAKENKVDIVAGLDFSDLEADVSGALIDLSFRDAKNKSILFAKILNNSLKKKVEVRNNSHHSAGFVVLKNSNMASVLIELGFITNKKDSKNLQKSDYRAKFIMGTIAAIDKYFNL
ncbi:MAG: N-acetylmuramoyl-L-alanine amidase family protein [Rickettsiales bacterium]